MYKVWKQYLKEHKRVKFKIIKKNNKDKSIPGAFLKEFWWLRSRSGLVGMSRTGGHNLIPKSRSNSDDELS